MITPQGVERLIDETRTELTERVETAIDALQGVHLERPEDRYMPPIDSLPRVKVEHPSSNPQNPQAAVLGHISDAERRYLAAKELAAHCDEQPVEDDGVAPLVGNSMSLDRRLARLSHSLRADATEAISIRLTHRGYVDHAVITDPATGYRQQISKNPTASPSENHDMIQQYKANVPRNVLEHLEEEVIRR